MITILRSYEVSKMNLKLEFERNKTCSIYSVWYILNWELKYISTIFPSFRQNLKNWNIKEFLIIFVFSIYTELIYERNFSVLWLFLATVTFYLNCLSVRHLRTHSEHWQNLQYFSCPSLSNKHKTSHVVNFRFSSKFKGSWWFPSDTHTTHETAECLLLSAINPSTYTYSHRSISHTLHILNE
jgi:hypothetical protein